MDPLCFFFLVFAMSLCASVYMCFVVTCWERGDLLALVCGVLLWICHLPIGILGQVWYLIVSSSDLCTLTYFQQGLNCLLRQSSSSEQLIQNVLEMIIYDPLNGLIWHYCIQLYGKLGFIRPLISIQCIPNSVWIKRVLRASCDQIIEVFL